MMAYFLRMHSNNIVGQLGLFRTGQGEFARILENCA